METVSTPPDGPVQAARPLGSVSLVDFEPSKPLFEADSCLEFLILSLCNNLTLKPKQAAGLLVQESKYLKKVMAKGLKGDFGPLQYWIQDIYSNTERLCDLLKTEQSGDALVQVMATFQTGFSSPDDEVRAWTCRLLSKLSFDFEEKGLSDDLWAWFSSPTGALQPVISLISSSDDSLLEVAVDLLFHMSQGKLIQLFSLKLRDEFEATGGYLGFVGKVIAVLLGSEATREELMDAGVVTYWAEICLREAENILGECRLTALVILHRLWLSCFSLRPDDDITVQALLTVFKRGTHDHLEVIRTSCCSLLFSVLEHLASLRSQQAPGVYKALALTLVEEHCESATEQFLLVSFAKLIERLPAMPLAPLMNILAKKYASEESWTVADIELFVQVSIHEKLSLQQAVQLIDICGRIYLTDGVYVRAASIPLSKLATRFLDMEAMQEYLIKFCKIMVVTLVNYSLEDAELLEIEVLSRISQKNMHMNLIKWLIQLTNVEFNQKLGEMLHGVNAEYRAVMNCDHGLIKALLEDTPYIPQVTVSDLTPPTPPAELTDPVEPTDENNYQIVPVDFDPPHDTEPSTILQLREDTEPSSILVKSPSSKASRSTSFPHRRVLHDLEKIKKMRVDREEKQKSFQERVQKEVLVRDKILRQQLEMRKVEQGLSRGVGGDDISIYPYGSVKTGGDSDEIQLKDFSPEESEEFEMLKIVSKKYFRAFKALFQKFSGSGFAVRKESGSSFEWLAERKSRMTDAELIKVLVLFRFIPTVITKEEVRSIMRSYCAKVAKQHELNSVDFDGFIGVLSQVSFYAYSEQAGRGALPPAIQLKQLVTHIRDNSQNQGISIDLFDEPDPGAGDKDVVRRLNALLRDDPDAVLPSGFKLSIEQDVELTYEIPAVLGVDKGYCVAMEILDEVVSGQFGCHFVEGAAKVVATRCAKGVKRDELPPLQDRSAASLQKARKVSPEVFPHHVLSPTLKFELAKVPDDLRAVAHECAQTLEAVLISASLGMGRVINRPMSQNRVRQRKHVEKTPEPVAEKVEKVENWKIRAKEAHERMLKNMQEKLEKKKREDDAEAERKQSLAEEQKRVSERAQREKEVRAKSLKEWTEKREIEKAKKQAEDAENRQIMEKQKKEQQHSFKQLQSKLQTLLKSKQEQWKTVREVAESQPTKLVEEKLQHQQRAAKLLQIEREKAVQKFAKVQETKSFTENSDVQQLLNSHTKQMEAVFRFFSRKAELKLDSDNLTGKLKLSDYAKMALQLDIVPVLVSPDVNTLIFKAITKTKTPEKGQPVTLEESDFREVLLSIADVARDKLNGMGDVQPGMLTVGTLEALFEYLCLNKPVQELTVHLKKLAEESNSTRSSREKRQILFNRRTNSTKPVMTQQDEQLPPVLTEVPAEMEQDREVRKEAKKRSITPVPKSEGVQTDYIKPEMKEEQVQFTEADEAAIDASDPPGDSSLDLLVS